MSETPTPTVVFIGTNEPTNGYVLKVLKALHEESVKETAVPPGM